MRPSKAAPDHTIRLESQDTNWNFYEGKLTIGEETHVLLSATRGVFCRRLVEQESVIIPARSEMDVPTIVIYDTLSATKFDLGNGEWMSEVGELGKGLQASSTLIPHRAKDVPLRVMNRMDTEVRLGKGTAMDELQPVEVLVQPTCPDVNGAQGGCIEELMDDVEAGVTGAERTRLRKLLQEFGGILSVNRITENLIWLRNLSTVMS